MSKLDKLLKRLRSKPNDFSWDEMVRILNHFEFQELPKGKTGGSRRKFIHPKYGIISLHKPHPGNILKKYQLEQLIQHLNTEGLI